MYIHVVELGLMIGYQGFTHTKGGYPPPNLSSPPPRFQTKFISTCNNISATSFLGPQKPPEATSENLNFLGKHTPDPPRSSVLLYDQFFPSLTKNPV